MFFFFLFTVKLFLFLVTLYECLYSGVFFYPSLPKKLYIFFLFFFNLLFLTTFTKSHKYQSVFFFFLFCFVFRSLILCLIYIFLAYLLIISYAKTATLCSAFFHMQIVSFRFTKKTSKCFFFSFYINFFCFFFLHKNFFCVHLIDYSFNSQRTDCETTRNLKKKCYSLK